MPELALGYQFFSTGGRRAAQAKKPAEPSSRAGLSNVLLRRQLPHATLVA
jgi:hypothetical protein